MLHIENQEYIMQVYNTISVTKQARDNVYGGHLYVTFRALLIDQLHVVNPENESEGK